MSVKCLKYFPFWLDNGKNGKKQLWWRHILKQICCIPSRFSLLIFTMGTLWQLPLVNTWFPVHLLENYPLINSEDAVRYKRERAITRLIHACNNIFLRWVENSAWHRNTNFDVEIWEVINCDDTGWFPCFLSLFSNLNGIYTFLRRNLTSISSVWRTVHRWKRRRACFVYGKILDNTRHC